MSIDLFWLYAINSHNPLKSFFLSPSFHNFVSGNFSSFISPIKSIVDKTCSEIDLLSRTLRRFQSEVLRWQHNHFSHSASMEYDHKNANRIYFFFTDVLCRMRLWNIVAHKVKFIFTIWAPNAQLVNSSTLIHTISTA